MAGSLAAQIMEFMTKVIGRDAVETIVAMEDLRLLLRRGIYGDAKGSNASLSS